MTLVALFSWWYTAGWVRLARRVGQRVERALEMFSVDLLAKTLFAPFRQISAEQVQGPFAAQLKALGDRTFSRFVGLIARSLFIIFGCLGALAVGVFGLVQLLVWPLVPLLPVIGLLAAAIGWMV